jgi:hypothetical protein
MATIVTRDLGHKSEQFPYRVSSNGSCECEQDPGAVQAVVVGVRASNNDYSALSLKFGCTIHNSQLRFTVNYFPHEVGWTRIEISEHRAKGDANTK